MNENRQPKQIWKITNCFISNDIECDNYFVSMTSLHGIREREREKRLNSSKQIAMILNKLVERKKNINFHWNNYTYFEGNRYQTRLQ